MSPCLALPVVDVPIIETPRVLEQFAQQPDIAASRQTRERDEPARNKPMPKIRSTVDALSDHSSWFSRMKHGLSKSSKNLADGMVNILIGGKEIDDELLEEVETQLLVADIGVEATKTIIQNLTERTAAKRADLFDGLV
jgi:fused signal recognition particle receptor